MKKIIFFLLITNFAYSQTLVKTYYDPYTKTKLKEVYQVKPNTPIVNGYYKSYDEFGNILVHRNYVNNKQNGKSTAYYGAYEASLMSDEVRDKCLGEISGVFNYKNDKLDGIQLKYDYSKDGVKFLNKKETYSDGVMIKFIEYFPNKQEKKVIQIGKCYEYYEDGSKFAEYTSDGNGQLQGNYTGWRKTGEIEVQGNFFNDEKDGEWIEYYEDGTIKSKELYELGKRLPTQEEKELSRQKEIEKAKKEEEKRKLLEEKRLAEQKEAERIKRIKEEKIALTKKVNDQSKEYEREKKTVEKLYVVEDKAGSMLLSETVYKTKKKHLYNAYVIAINYLNSELINTTDLQEKSELLSLGLRLTDKMKGLRDGKSRDLEKKLKKIDQPTEIIQTLGIKK